MAHDFEYVLKAINSVGFPIWVAAFLLLRIDHQLRRQGDLLHRLTAALRLQSKALCVYDDHEEGS